MDNFKTINEENGHKAGNLVLKELARILKTQFSQGLISHISGSEFSIFICGKENLQQLTSTLQKFQQQVNSKPFIINDTVITIDLSLVVIENLSLHSLLKGADNALIKTSQQRDNKLVINSEQIPDKTE
ncbi:MAG: diguanylate cyclase [Alteromonadales bacterium]|nr:diguanylate cyclase [Alteromonadales bacterium]MCP4987484.1 diguanylate cyclase [Colwellia sp.]